MKRIAWLCAALLLMVLGAAADDVIKIQDVGLSYYHSSSGPTPIRLVVTNPTAQQLLLTLRIDLRADKGSCVPSTFENSVALRALERREIELPLIFPSCPETKVQVSAIDASGKQIGYADTGITQFQPNPPVLVAILCTDKMCGEVQGQIALSGEPEEIKKKNGEIKYAVLDQPRSNWWSYSAARILVLAAPLNQYTEQQKAALEEYVRRGGVMILLQQEVNDESFLAPYREGSQQRVGQGTLYNVSSLSGNQLGQLFSGKSLEMLTAYNWRYGGNYAGAQYYLGPQYGGIAWLSGRIGPSFQVPRLRWVLFWLGGYIIILGAVNFAVLRRFKRLEWGWLTIALCAILFSAWFYFSNHYRGPHHFVGTNVAVFWMDEHSPLAFAEYGLTMASPKRTDTVMKIPSEAVLQPGSWAGSNDGVQDIYDSITGSRSYGTGWRVALDDPQQLFLPMLRWSSRSLMLNGFREFSGTVHWAAPNRLKNDTGKDFHEAVFVDRQQGKIWFLNSFGAGQELDLAALPFRKFSTSDDGLKQNDKDHDRKQLTLEHLPVIEGAAKRIGYDQRMFIGSLDSGTLPADLDQKNVEWRKAALVVVPLS